LQISAVSQFFLVANKWLHERGQEFLRPCTLENQATDEVDVRHWRERCSTVKQKKQMRRDK